jgi:uncharacterized protein
MTRILFFIVLAFVFWLVIRMLGASRKRGDGPLPPADDEIAPRTGIEAITQCAWCGVHVPRGEAVTLPDGRVYCSVAHRDAAREVAAPVDRSVP